MVSVGEVIGRVWHSATVNSLASLSSRALSLLLLAPIVMAKFAAPDAAVWFLFTTLVALLLLGDSGISSTYARLISLNQAIEEKTDPKNIGRILSGLCLSYGVLIILAAVVACVLGILTLSKPISLSTSPYESWLAGAVYLLSTLFLLCANMLATTLIGFDRVAIVKRWDAVSTSVVIGASATVVLLGGNLVTLALANLLGAILAMLRNLYLCADDALIRTYIRDIPICSFSTTKEAWPSVWRSTLGVALGLGLIQVSGLWVAQFATPVQTASYIFQLRFIQSISVFSQAPFYSKLPTLARLKAQDDLAGLMAVARRGMSMSYFLLLTGYVVAGLFFEPLIAHLGNVSVTFDKVLWMLFGTSMLVERYAAMHMQIYSTSNHIVWHKALGGTGAVAIIFTVIFSGGLGVWAFPAGLIIGNILFFVPYVCSRSYALLAVRPLDFDIPLTTVVIMLFLACTVTIALN